MGFLEGILYMIWRGLAIGVIISAPMGPVGIFCVQRTLEKGRLSGFFTGIGASISDLLYCLLTGFGLSFIEGFLKANQSIIQIFGSFVLVIFGIYLFKSTPARKVKKPGAEINSQSKNILSGFLFTFSNPLIIFLIIGLFARFDFFLPEISLLQYIIGYVFIVIGALSWWWIVSYFVDKLRAHFNVRSMWLINKITGGIIMIFAIVGIVTGFSGIASAKSYNPIYLNSERGFASLGSNEKGSPLLIESPTSSPQLRSLALEDGGNFTFSFRLKNLNNASGKKYSYVDASGKKHSVKNPAWQLILKENGKKAVFNFKTVDRHTDDIILPVVNIDCKSPADSISMRVSDNIDLFTGANSFKLTNREGNISLFAGNRKFNLVCEDLSIDFNPDSVAFAVMQGGCVEIDQIVLECAPAHHAPSDMRWSHFSMPDVRNSYFSRSSDPIEGEWQIFDRMLEDERLRTGGDYRLAIIKANGGYDVVYLNGAMKNEDSWAAGMLKARLNDTAFKNVFDVTWLDPSGREIEGEIKAQFDGNNIISLIFPDHGSSSLRLHKLTRYDKN